MANDTTFECVAGPFGVDLYSESMADLLARACKRLPSWYRGGWSMG